MKSNWKLSPISNRIVLTAVIPSTSLSTSTSTSTATGFSSSSTATTIITAPSLIQANRTFSSTATALFNNNNNNSNYSQNKLASDDDEVTRIALEAWGAGGSGGGGRGNDDSARNPNNNNNNRTDTAQSFDARNAPFVLDRGIRHDKGRMDLTDVVKENRLSKLEVVEGSAEEDGFESQSVANLANGSSGRVNFATTRPNHMMLVVDGEMLSALRHPLSVFPIRAEQSEIPPNCCSLVQRATAVELIAHRNVSPIYRAVMDHKLSVDVEADQIAQFQDLAGVSVQTAAMLARVGYELLEVAHQRAAGASMLDFSEMAKDLDEAKRMEEEHELLVRDSDETETGDGDAVSEQGEKKKISKSKGQPKSLEEEDEEDEAMRTTLDKESLKKTNDGDEEADDEEKSSANHDTEKKIALRRFQERFSVQRAKDLKERLVKERRVIEERRRKMLQDQRTASSAASTLFADDGGATASPSSSNNMLLPALSDAGLFLALLACADRGAVYLVGAICFLLGPRSMRPGERERYIPVVARNLHNSVLFARMFSESIVSPLCKDVKDLPRYPGDFLSFHAISLAHQYLRAAFALDKPDVARLMRTVYEVFGDRAATVQRQWEESKKKGLENHYMYSEDGTRAALNLIDRSIGYIFTQSLLRLASVTNPAAQASFHADQRYATDLMERLDTRMIQIRSIQMENLKRGGYIGTRNPNANVKNHQSGPSNINNASASELTTSSSSNLTPGDETHDQLQQPQQPPPVADKVTRDRQRFNTFPPPSLVTNTQLYNSDFDAGTKETPPRWAPIPLGADPGRIDFNNSRTPLWQYLLFVARAAPSIHLNSGTVCCLGTFGRGFARHMSLVERAKMRTVINEDRAESQQDMARFHHGYDSKMERERMRCSLGYASKYWPTEQTLRDEWNAQKNIAQEPDAPTDISKCIPEMRQVIQTEAVILENILPIHPVINLFINVFRQAKDWHLNQQQRELFDVLLSDYLSFAQNQLNLSTKVKSVLAKPESLLFLHSLEPMLTTRKIDLFPAGSSIALEPAKDEGHVQSARFQKTDLFNLNVDAIATSASQEIEAAAADASKPPSSSMEEDLVGEVFKKEEEQEETILNEPSSPQDETGLATTTTSPNDNNSSKKKPIATSQHPDRSKERVFFVQTRTPQGEILRVNRFDTAAYAITTKSFVLFNHIQTTKSHLTVFDRFRQMTTLDLMLELRFARDADHQLVEFIGKLADVTMERLTAESNLYFSLKRESDLVVLQRRLQFSFRLCKGVFKRSIFAVDTLRIKTVNIWCALMEDDPARTAKVLRGDDLAQALMQILTLFNVSQKLRFANNGGNNSNNMNASGSNGETNTSNMFYETKSSLNNNNNNNNDNSASSEPKLLAQYEIDAKKKRYMATCYDRAEQRVGDVASSRDDTMASSQTAHRSGNAGASAGMSAGTGIDFASVSKHFYNLLRICASSHWRLMVIDADIVDASRSENQVNANSFLELSVHFSRLTQFHNLIEQLAHPSISKTDQRPMLTMQSQMGMLPILQKGIDDTFNGIKMLKQTFEKIRDQTLKEIEEREKVQQGENNNNQNNNNQASTSSSTSSPSSSSTNLLTRAEWEKIFLRDSIIGTPDFRKIPQLAYVYEHFFIGEKYYYCSSRQSDMIQLNAVMSEQKDTPSYHYYKRQRQKLELALHANTEEIKGFLNTTKTLTDAQVWESVFDSWLRIALACNRIGQVCTVQLSYPSSRGKFRGQVLDIIAGPMQLLSTFILPEIKKICPATASFLTADNLANAALLVRALKNRDVAGTSSAFGGGRQAWKSVAPIARQQISELLCCLTDVFKTTSSPLDPWSASATKELRESNQELSKRSLPSSNAGINNENQTDSASSSSSSSANNNNNNNIQSHTGVSFDDAWGSVDERRLAISSVLGNATSAIAINQHYIKISSSIGSQSPHGAYIRTAEEMMRSRAALSEERLRRFLQSKATTERRLKEYSSMRDPEQFAETVSSMNRGMESSWQGRLFNSNNNASTSPSTDECNNNNNNNSANGENQQELPIEQSPLLRAWRQLHHPGIGQWVVKYKKRSSDRMLKSLLRNFHLMGAPSAPIVELAQMFGFIFFALNFEQAKREGISTFERLRLVPMIDANFFLQHSESPELRLLQLADLTRFLDLSCISKDIETRRRNHRASDYDVNFPAFSSMTLEKIFGNTMPYTTEAAELEDHYVDTLSNLAPTRAHLIRLLEAGSSAGDRTTLLMSHILEALTAYPLEQLINVDARITKISQILKASEGTENIFSDATPDENRAVKFAGIPHVMPRLLNFTENFVAVFLISLLQPVQVHQRLRALCQLMRRQHFIIDEIEFDEASFLKKFFRHQINNDGSDTATRVPQHHIDIQKERIQKSNLAKLEILTKIIAAVINSLCVHALKPSDPAAAQKLIQFNITCHKSDHLFKLLCETATHQIALFRKYPDACRTLVSVLQQLKDAQELATTTQNAITTMQTEKNNTTSNAKTTATQLPALRFCADAENLLDLLQAAIEDYQQPADESNQENNNSDDQENNNNNQVASNQTSNDEQNAIASTTTATTTPAAAPSADAAAPATSSLAAATDESKTVFNEILRRVEQVVARGSPLTKFQVWQAALEDRLLQESCTLYSHGQDADGRSSLSADELCVAVKESLPLFQIFLKKENRFFLAICANDVMSPSHNLTKLAMAAGSSTIEAVDRIFAETVQNNNNSNNSGENEINYYKHMLNKMNRVSDVLRDYEAAAAMSLACRTIFPNRAASTMEAILQIMFYALEVSGNNNTRALVNTLKSTRGNQQEQELSREKELLRLRHELFHAAYQVAWASAAVWRKYLVYFPCSIIKLFEVGSPSFSGSNNNDGDDNSSDSNNNNNNQNIQDQGVKSFKFASKWESTTPATTTNTNRTKNNIPHYNGEHLQKLHLMDFSLANFLLNDKPFLQTENAIFIIPGTISNAALPGISGSQFNARTSALATSDSVNGVASSQYFMTAAARESRKMALVARLCMTPMSQLMQLMEACTANMRASPHGTSLVSDALTVLEATLLSSVNIARFCSSTVNDIAKLLLSQDCRVRYDSGSSSSSSSASLTNSGDDARSLSTSLKNIHNDVLDKNNNKKFSSGGQSLPEDENNNNENDATQKSIVGITPEEKKNLAVEKMLAKIKGGHHGSNAGESDSELLSRLGPYRLAEIDPISLASASTNAKNTSSDIDADARTLLLSSVFFSSNNNNNSLQVKSGHQPTRRSASFGLNPAQITSFDIFRIIALIFATNQPLTTGNMMMMNSGGGGGGGRHHAAGGAGGGSSSSSSSSGTLTNAATVGNNNPLVIALCFKFGEALHTQGPETEWDIRQFKAVLNYSPEQVAKIEKQQKDVVTRVVGDSISLDGRVDVSATQQLNSLMALLRETQTFTLSRVIREYYTSKNDSTSHLSEEDGKERLISTLLSSAGGEGNNCNGQSPSSALFEYLGASETETHVETFVRLFAIFDIIDNADARARTFTARSYLIYAKTLLMSAAEPKGFQDIKQLEKLLPLCDFKFRKFSNASAIASANQARVKFSDKLTARAAELVKKM